MKNKYEGDRVMKKIIFYATNSIVCSIFLAVRFSFSLFVVDKEYILDSDMAKINIFTFLLIIILLINIVMSYIEAKKL